MFCSEFQEIRTGKYFGLKEDHSSREVAEQYAVDALVELGEPEHNARAAASSAGWTCADTRAIGYGVRIFEKR